MSDPTALTPAPAQLRGLVDAAGRLEGPERIATLQQAVREDPLFLEGWARLGEAAYEAGDDVAAYAYARVGYHRGLDSLRAAGWRPDREVHWEQEGNRGFLLALYVLMKASASIGEGVEARRCRDFLLQLDPADPLGVGEIMPRDLSRRLPD